MEVDIQPITDWIRRGNWLGPQLHVTSHSAKFESSDLAFVEIAGFRSVEDVSNDPLVQSSATIFLTAVGDNDERPKIGLVFALERTIFGSKEMAALNAALSLRLNGQHLDTDIASLVLEAPIAECEIHDRGLPNPQIDELIRQGARPEQAEQVGSNKASRKYVGLLEKDRQLGTRSGRTGMLRDLSKGETVFCPFHYDTRGTAFVVTSRLGVNGVHCKVCEVTYWPRDNGADYDFFSFDAAVRHTQTYGERHHEPDRFEAFTGDYPEAIQGLQRARIYEVNEKYLNDKYLPDTIQNFLQQSDVLFIKSPKGSGKTELMGYLSSSGKVLMVGHRRSLIRQASDRLGLNCYLDDPGIRSRSSFSQRMGVCLDSITMVPAEAKYDLVIIDESEQVLTHFLSDTLARKRNHIFHRFGHLLRNTKSVVALDADLSWASFHFLCNWAQKQNEKIAATLVVNNWTEDQGEIQVYSSKNQLLGDLLAALSDGKRCYVTSNSKAMIDHIAESINRDICPERDLIRITSDTTERGNAKVDKFMASPTDEATKYRAILASPSISSGVDIAFPNDEQLFDCVYGFFEPLIISHFECDQQLARVRHPKEVKVFVSGRRFHFESDLEVIKSDLLRSDMMQHLMTGYSDEGPTYQETDPLLELAGAIVSQQRASKNDLKGHFLRLKQKQGWEIISVEPDENISAIGSRAMALGKQLTQQKYEDALLSAPTLTDEEYRNLREKMLDEEIVTLDEKIAYERETIQRFYGEKITRGLIQLDDRGRYRRKVRMYEAATSRDEMIESTRQQLIAEEWKSDTYRYLTSDQARRGFILKALQLTGFYDGKRFDKEQEICRDDLRQFVTFLQGNKARYETLVGRELPRDIKVKPMKTVRQLLKEFGLGLESSSIRKAAGRKIYWYRIDNDSLSEVERYMEHTYKVKNSEKELSKGLSDRGDEKVA